MLVVSLAFLAGIVLVQFIPMLPGTGWLLLPFAAGLLAWSRHWRMAAWLCAGVVWSWAFAAWQLQQRLPDTWEGVDLQVTGRIDGLVEPRDGDGLRIPLLIQAVRLQEHWQPASLRVRLNWYHTTAQPGPGETWQFTVRLKQPHGFANPDGFDYEGHLFRQGIRATGYVRDATNAHRLATAHGYWLDRTRQWLQARMRPVTDESRSGPLLEALTIGVRDRVDDAHWQVLRRTGTSHLMAISGLHIGLVSGVLFWLARRMWSYGGLAERCPAPLVAGWVALGGALGYGALAGFSVPTRRAVIMVAAVLLALLWRRGLRPGQSLALALMAVLLLDPLSVLDTGFWLSFAAVALLALFLAERRDNSGYWRSLVRMQWILTLGLFPLMLALFQEASLIAPFTNLVAVPWVGLLVVPLALLSTLLSGLWPVVAQAGWQLADLLLHGLWQGLELASHFPASSWSHGVATLWVPVAAMAGLIVVLAARAWSLRLLGTLWCLPLLLYRSDVPPPGTAWFTLLDVGQGLSALVRTQHHVLIYDTGPRFPSGFNTGDAVLVPLLRAQGITAVDRLVISHGDNDHIGGAQALYKQVPVYSIRTSVPERISWANSRRCHAGDHWEWDGVQFRVLSPGDSQLTGNNASCVLRIQAGEHSLLLPGDIEAEAERRLLADGRLTPVEVLVAPHHGSRTSSTPAFVNRLRPQQVLFAVGYRNRWRFPRPEIVGRYRRQGSTHHDTARDGALRMVLEPGSPLTVQPQRLAHRRYWHRPL